MELAADFVGALVVTYFVSRALLWVLRGMDGLARVAMAHAASWILITVIVFLIEGYAVDAGVIYLLPQILWFVLDRARLGGPATA